MSFKVGDYVIRSEIGYATTAEITIGKSYKVLELGSYNQIVIINDQDSRVGYLPEFFIFDKSRVIHEILSEL